MTSALEARPDAPRSFCVYTTLVGGYERLNEQAVAAESRIPFICLTDDAGLRSETWQLRLVPTLFPMDAVRSQRALKLRPHEFLPEFDGSLFIDNSVLLKQPPEALVELFQPEPGFCLPVHSFRDAVIDEFLEVARDGLDDQARVLEQLYHTALECPGVLREKPYWTGLMLRDHRNPAVRGMLDLWLSHVQRYSRRDQLSANLAFRRAGWNPQLLPIDNHDSRFHSWPHRSSWSPSRFAQVQASSFGPSDSRTRHLELKLEAAAGKLAEERRLRSDLLASTAWRATAPFRALGDRHPAVARSVRRVSRALSGSSGAAPGPPSLPGESPSKQGGGPAPALPENGPPEGREFHVAPGDERGRQLLLHGGDLNPPTLSIWRRLLAERPWTHVLDVGANYGEMLLNVELPPAARILAFEPNPHILVFLVRNLLDARLRVGVVPAAVSDRKGFARLLVDRGWSGTTRLGGDDAAGEDGELEARTVPTTTLADELCQGRDASGIRALVKVDVEGHEIPVLEGIRPIVGELEDFAALVEILHLSPADRGWLLDHFEVELFDPASASLVRVEPGTADRLTDLLAGGTLYPQDVVLRRKGRSRDRGNSWARGAGPQFLLHLPDADLGSLLVRH